MKHNKELCEMLLHDDNVDCRIVDNLVRGDGGTKQIAVIRFVIYDRKSMPQLL